MKIVKQPIKLQAVREQAFCDCGGELEATSRVLLSSPPQYPHECQVCGRQYNLKDSYPKVSYREDPIDGSEVTSE